MSTLNNVELAKLQKSSGAFLVGVGGWAYFPLKRGNKLEICSKLYDYVEVNSTFYSIPSIERVKHWKRLVHEEFEFTVKANRELTHVGKLEPKERNFQIFDTLVEICETLKSQILHFQFPPSFNLTSERIKSLRSFFGCVSNKGSLQFAIEARDPNAMGSKEYQELLGDYDLIPTSDASKESELIVSEKSKTLYSRVFGLGQHTKWSFDSDEIAKLIAKVEEIPAKRKYVTFHNMTMYEDASRAKSFLKGGKEIAYGRPTHGLGSIKMVLASSRIEFPISRESLIDEIGWKTYDDERGMKRHISKPLMDLPMKDGAQFESIDSVISLLEQGHSKQNL